MKSIGNLRIGTRLSLGFGVLIVLLVALAMVGLNMVSVVNDHIEVILHNRFVKVKDAQFIENEVNKQLRAMRTAMLAPNLEDRKIEISKIDASASAVAEKINELTKTVTSEQGSIALQQLMESRSVFKIQETEVIEDIQSEKIEEARALLFSKILPLQQNYLNAIEHFTKTQTDSMEHFGADALDLTKRSLTLLITLLCIAVALAVTISYLLTRSITLPIAEAVRVAETVAAGDLMSSIEVSSRDETGQLLSSLKSMNTRLQEIVGQVRQSSDAIATGSGQIAAGNSDLSQRTEKQASSLQQTAASMEQITAMVKQSSDSAKVASDLASATSQAASQSGQIVLQAVSTMHDSLASSRRVSDITAVIDGIAFQTNILALNAAVEAARAGEQGKGFSVVASEVRLLAHRAASAAKEIKELITENVSRVEAGTGLVTNVGKTMEQIVLQIREVAELISAVSTSSDEQNAGVEQIGKAVSHMDEVTQHNAALVEESAAAAASLNTQALRLAKVVDYFRLRQEA